MQLVLFLLLDEPGPPPDPFGPPGHPFLQYLSHPHDFGHSRDQDIEVTGEGVLKLCGPEELLHQLFRVSAPLQVNGQLQAGQVGLIPYIGDLLQLARLHKLGDLVHNGLCRGGIGDLIDLDDPLLLDIPPFGPHLEGAPAGAVDLRHLCPVVKKLSPRGEIGSFQDGEQVALRVLHKGDGGFAHLLQIEAAEVGGHAHGNALIGRDQHIGEGGGQ